MAHSVTLRRRHAGTGRRLTGHRLLSHSDLLRPRGLLCLHGLLRKRLLHRSLTAAHDPILCEFGAVMPLACIAVRSVATKFDSASVPVTVCTAI